MDINEIIANTKKDFMKSFKEREADIEVRSVAEQPAIDGLILDNPQLEYILDRRFLAWGRCALSYGKKGCAKTSFFFDLAKTVIKQGGRAIWVETENAPDFNYMADQGVDTSKVIYCHPHTLEEALTFIKKFADNIPADNETPYLICLDSIAGVTTEIEADQDKIGEQKGMGKHARLMSEFYRQMDVALEPHKVIFLATNQLKEAIGGMTFGAEKPEALIGGQAQYFHSTYQWKFARTGYIHGPDENGVERVCGSYHSITAKRNKLGREGNDQCTTFDVYAKGGIDWYTPLVRDNLSKDFTHLVSKAGAYCTWKTPNIPYYYVNETGETIEDVIDTEKKYTAVDLGVMISNSPAAKEVIRNAFHVRPLPSEEELKVVEEEKKLKRQKLKKNVKKL